MVSIKREDLFLSQHVGAWLSLGSLESLAERSSDWAGTSVAEAKHADDHEDADQRPGQLDHRQPPELKAQCSKHHCLDWERWPQRKA
jgi:hypothetical protein